MPDLFSPFTLKDVTLRNRIAMSPMTMHRSVDGKMGDFHLMYLGARAAGGFGLVFPEQVAVSPEGRTTIHCAGMYDDAQVEGHERVTAMLTDMGAVPGIQLGHTGRNGSEMKPWVGGGLGHQLPPEHPEGFTCVAPSAKAYGGTRSSTPHELTVGGIRALQRRYREAAARALAAGYRWLELHFAHGYLCAEFFSPLANERTDAYGGSLENRTRFLLEVIDSVREVWPERLPLTVRLGSDDYHPDGIQWSDALTALGWMVDRGIDLADLSWGGNTNEMVDPTFFFEEGGWLARAAEVKQLHGIPMACSWNLGAPATADAAIRSGAIDVALLGRAALANPHWPVWAARELGRPDPFDLVPEDWAWWLRNFRGFGPSIGWPAAVDGDRIAR